MRVLFMGSPAVATIPLRKLCELKTGGEISLAGVVSQAAKPQGRGMQVAETAVAHFARTQGLRVFQPLRASDPAFIEELQKLQLDVILTAAYGQILSADFLSLAQCAVLNLHPSLLPRFRGATPVQSAILAGEEETGVTLCFTVARLDAGNIIVQQRYPLTPQTSEQLTERLFTLGAELLPRAFTLLQDSTFKGVVQDEAQATVCKKLAKADGKIDWSAQAEEIYRKFLAFHVWPGIFTYWNGKRVVLKSVGLPEQHSEHYARSSCGNFFRGEGFLKVKTGRGMLYVRSLQVDGRKTIMAEDFANSAGQQNVHHFTCEV